jgi:hypothetical protein
MHAAPSILSVCAFLKRRAPGYRHAKRGPLLEFVGWYWRDARIGIVREHGRIVAVALARCVHDVKEGDDPFRHDEAAPIVWVDDIVSRHPQGIGLLLQQVRQRFGPREAFAGRVFNRDGELRMLPFRIVDKITTGDLHHGPTQHSRRPAAA